MSGSSDSPRYCMFCKVWGDHHTDRCPKTFRRDEKLRRATEATEARLAEVRRKYRSDGVDLGEAESERVEEIVTRRLGPSALDEKDGPPKDDA